MRDLVEATPARPPIWLPDGVVQQPSRRRPELVVESFRELEELPPEPEWLWRGFLAPGLLTMLAGHTFVGKSMLISGLLKAIDSGDPFLDSRTTRASALLVTEEARSTLAVRARLFGLYGIGSGLITRANSVTRDWKELITLATERALEGGHRLLVIDTLPGLAGLGHEQENDAGAIGERLRPLQQAAAKGLAVVFLHHVNSQGQPRGSKALGGIVDISVRLLRKEPSRTVRLETISRFPTATTAQLKAELIKAPDGWFYQPLGNSSSAAKGGEREERSTDRRLREALTYACPEGLTYNDLDGLPDLSSDIGKKRLPSWVGRGEVVRTGTGGKGDPFRFCICPGTG